ncbi:uncharacterized protein LTHEOB_36 [Lasiodiplodia theobromae]|uniref:uncharacterized protein n=1 Tax=Lasiodiplodia theobromae TaxID=45133 RepID=UPI0015C3A645|nr:uncharacterized protein LTHEOB_36 [Lasiodiplodia theobromae]KAF4543337.1 hypothetical protein LTHEOB_36 [Lasiodiplodia theobromae]
MPGIHDAHTHLLGAATQQLSEALIGTNSDHLTLGPNIKTASCHCEYAHTLGEWIVASFYSALQFPDGQPDRKYLDTEFPDTPVAVRDPSLHNCLVNTEALKRLGYDSANPPEFPGGQFVRRETGEVTGELLEAASGELWMNMPQPPATFVRRALEHSMRVCNRYGITSCQEASANTAYLKALREIEMAGGMTVDLHTHIVHSPARYAQEEAEGLQALLHVADVFESECVRTRFVKFWLDGAPLPPHLTQSDLREDGRPDEAMILVDWDTLLGALVKYDAKGYTCKIHCAGEGSVRRALDAIEKVRERNADGPSHEVAHCNAVHEDDIPRFKRLRVTAEMSPAIFHSPEVALVPHLLRWPFRQMLDHDVRMTIGTDYFLTPTPNLFPTLQAVVGKLSAEEILRAITIEGAKAVGRDHELGSIQEGKLANFISVDSDLTQGGFEDAKVLETWHRGKSVWASGDV